MPDHPDIAVEIVVDYGLADVVADRFDVGVRLPTSGTLNAWRLFQDGREVRVRVDGPLIFKTIDLIFDTAILTILVADVCPRRSNS